MRIGAVSRYPENRHSQRVELSERGAEFKRFLGASGGVVPRVEIQDQAAVSKVSPADRLSIRRRQSELRSLFAVACNITHFNLNLLR
jgi:hypothetical protein